MTLDRTNQPITRGAHHIGLTVPNLEQAKRFFTEALDYRAVGERPEYPAAFLTDGKIVISLWQTEDPERATPFDRRNNIGLHHLALSIESTAVLWKLFASLQKRDDTKVEFAPELIGDGPSQHMMCLMPGGIRIELIATGVPSEEKT